MKKNVSKFLMGIFFCSLVFLGCPQPNPSADSFDPASSNQEVKGAFDKALQEVKSTPKNEEEFQEMVKEIIAEFSSINGNNARFVSPNGDEISSKADIIEKLKSIIDNIEKSVSSTPSIGKEMKFSFDESINIKDATVTDLIGALSEIDELKSIVGNIDLPEDQKKLANDLVKINNLYAKAKADINFDYKLMSPEPSDDSIGSANVEFLASAAVLNLEKLANKTLPIKAVSAVVSMDANASATYKDANEIMTMGSSFGTDIENTLSGASFGYNAEGKITLAVCTKSGIGGKLIVEGNVSIDKDLILGYLKIMKEFEEKIKDINDYKKITEEMINDIDKLLGEKFKIKVSIGDFSKEYSYKELAVLGNNFSSL